MNDPLDSMKTMQRDPTCDTIGDMLTQRPDEAIVLAGRYRIVRKLGEGGMGSVWLAEDTKLDGRQVAIKMLPAVLVANKRAIQQLKAEAKVAIQLAHPNIATLRAFEESEEGPFLVMDYIEGQTLEDLLAERETLSEDEVMRLFKPVAEALDYAHSQGVVHRDVKPSNILIRQDGTPFITDFGIARELKETMTRVTGKMSSGTLPYMSPEQLRGEAPEPAQDVYSLAATIYECLAGTPPFHRGDIQYQIVHEDPAPLEKATRFTNRIISALSKVPEERAQALFPAKREAGLCSPEVEPDPAPVTAGGWHYLHPVARERILNSVSTSMVLVDGVPVRVSDDDVHRLVQVSAVRGVDYWRGERVCVSSLDALVFSQLRELTALYFRSRKRPPQNEYPVRLWAEGSDEAASAEIKRRIERGDAVAAAHLLILLARLQDVGVTAEFLLKAERNARLNNGSLIELAKIHSLVTHDLEAAERVLCGAEESSLTSLFPVQELVEASLMLGHDDDETKRLMAKAKRCAHGSMYAVTIWVGCAKASGLLHGDIPDAEQYLHEGVKTGGGPIVCSRVWAMLKPGSHDLSRYLREAENAATYSFHWTACARNWFDLLGDESSAVACMRRAESELAQRENSGLASHDSRSWSDVASAWSHLGAHCDTFRCQERAEENCHTCSEWLSVATMWADTLNESSRADACLERATAKAETSDELIECALAWHSVAGDLSRALDLLQSAVEAAGSDPLELTGVAQAFLRLNPTAPSSTDCLALAEAAARSSNEWVACGTCWRAMGDGDRVTLCGERAGGVARDCDDWVRIAEYCLLGGWDEEQVRACLLRAESAAGAEQEWKAIARLWFILEDPVHARSCIERSLSDNALMTDDIDEDDEENGCLDEDNEESGDFQNWLHRRWDRLRELVIDDPQSPRALDMMQQLEGKAKNSCDWANVALCWNEFYQRPEDVARCLTAAEYHAKTGENYAQCARYWKRFLGADDAMKRCLEQAEKRDGWGAFAFWKESGLLSEASRCLKKGEADFHNLQQWLGQAVTWMRGLEDRKQSMRCIEMAESMASKSHEWVSCAQTWGRTLESERDVMRCIHMAESFAKDGSDWRNCSRAWVELLADSRNAEKCMAKANSLVNRVRRFFLG
jgi:serine/threonine protein kinase